jgi:hypothetical protein
MTFHVIYNRGFQKSTIFALSLIRFLYSLSRNATDQSGLITGTKRVFLVDIDIEKPPNHVFKFYELKAMIRSTTVDDLRLKIIEIL